MKTLSDLKRDLITGKTITMIYNQIDRPNLLNLTRYIISKNTTGVKIGLQLSDTKGSFLEYPKKASLCEYGGKSLKIYNAGYRPLTEREQEILNNLPSHRKENEERAIQEALSDGSGLYYADKRYLKDLDSEYLSGHEIIRGLKYNYNDKNVMDETIKGTLSLEYIIN